MRDLLLPLLHTPSSLLSYIRGSWLQYRRVLQPVYFAACFSSTIPCSSAPALAKKGSDAFVDGHKGSAVSR